MRNTIVEEVDRIIREGFGGHYSVRVFGSSRYGLDRADSDLDLVILDPSRKNGFPPWVHPKLSAVYDVRKVAHQLSKSFRILSQVPTASVPIVKFKDVRSGIHCDICVNERLGLINTYLLSQYCKLLPWLRTLVKTIKIWAKPLGLNDVQAGGFNSYTLTLMTIAWLQSCGMLPNLQENSALGSTELYWMRPRKKTPLATKCVVEWDRTTYEDEAWTPGGDLRLYDSLVAWFRYWGYEYDYATKIVSIRHGGMVARQEPFDGRLACRQGPASSGTRSTLVTENAGYPSLIKSMRVEDLESQTEVGSVLEPRPESLDLGHMFDTSAEGKFYHDPMATWLAADEERSNRHPLQWANHPVVVSDPFIRSKVRLPAGSHKPYNNMDSFG
ncbi:hypothetical protein K488DRAFT_72465 [Vararia minispora EC-137]|uniref:Uncharacterized protein n=1 Tax=Vararia minispora EC-137 TaxID=1314806 RepID=A0ACB8QED7_9AGAM|nr:hypothetical protein K488DRAFT_72465 [Vararia minispora EC-137]